MPPSARPLARAGLALLVLGLVPNRAMAQHALHLDHSLALVQVHDDNLFSAPEAREPDDIWRLSPRLGVGHRSGRLMLQAHYELDAEVFKRHPELNTAAARQAATLELGWTASKLLAAGASASYEDVQAAGLLNTLTGLEVGRRPARRLASTESLSRRLGALTKATVEHHFMREEVVGGPGTDLQFVSVGLERRLGPADRGRLSYSARRFAFGQEVAVSHVLTLAWSREVTPLAHFDFEAGPRLSGHRVGAEVTAGLKHRFRRGEAGIVYVNTQTTVVGRSGPVTANGVTVTFSRQLFGSLQVGGGPAAFRVNEPGSEITVYRLGLNVVWRVTRRLSLTASHQFSLQDSGPARAGGTGTEIARNTLLIGVTAASAAH